MCRAVTLTTLLVGVDFLDELSAGLPVVGTPDIQSSFGLRYSTTALVLFVLPQLLGLVLEPPFYVLADRHPRRRFVVGGLVAMAACYFAAALSWSPVLFAVAIALAAAASGVGVNLAQATLMDESPGQHERMMARWALSGLLGDFAAPALFWILSVVALGWRTALVSGALLLLLYASSLARRSFPPPSGEAGAPIPWRRAVGEALRNRRLLVWLFGGSLCSLLDEILVVFGGLHLRERLDLDAGDRSLVLMAFVAGSVAGLLLTEWRLRRGTEPLVLLAASGSACTVAYLGWIFAPGLHWSAGLMAAAGLFAAPLYPIARAQAYRQLAGGSGMVNAISMLFQPLEMAFPLILGLVADRFGLAAALLLLAAQPIGLVAIARFAGKRCS